MKSIGLVISHKNNEHRKAILPYDINKIKNKNMLFFEKGYANSLNIEDEEYLKAGAFVVSREEALSQDILVDVKLGDSNFISNIDKGKILVGWAHAAQSLDFTTKVIEGNHSVIAWENMFLHNRYIYYRNREIAGEASVLDGLKYSGKLPYDLKVALLGNGQTAKGALRILHGLGSNVTVYRRNHEALFRKEMFDYDVIVNCIYWDIRRKDRIIYKEDIQKMKKGTLIIDVSCNNQLEIETSKPTTLSNPTYEVSGVIHYCVDNSPSLFPFSVSKVISKEFSNMVDNLVLGEYNDIINNSIIIKNGKILDKEIINFRKIRNLKIE